MDRRSFLQATVAATAGGFSSLSSGQSPNDQITLGVMGVRGRGGGLLHACAAQSDVVVKYICDLDPDVLAKRTRKIADRTGRKPQAIKDFRKILDDKAIDAIVIGTPDHWHALPTIFACQAGKDVYVEKPDGHNVIEGQTMVAAARRHQRIVQLGTQWPSGTFQANAMKYISAGNLGTVRFAKAWESTGKVPSRRIADSSPPAGIDYDMWLGPAPQRPFNRAASTVPGAGFLTTAAAILATMACTAWMWPVGDCKRRWLPQGEITAGDPQQDFRTGRQTLF